MRKEVVGFGSSQTWTVRYNPRSTSSEKGVVSVPDLSLTGEQEELRERAPTIYEGTTQIHKTIQARHALVTATSTTGRRRTVRSS